MAKGLSSLGDEALYDISGGDELDHAEIDRVSSSAPYDYFDDPPENYYDPEGGWWPSLYEEQMKAFLCEKPYILLHGERFSGKTIVALNMVVKHCHAHDDALAMIVTITKTSAKTGGAWTKLFTEVLPEWEEGIGLAYTSSKMDTERNHYAKIQNVYGGWSTVMLKSIPAESMIAERWKGAEPTFVFPDELTETPIDASGYFDKVVQQLFRKKRKPGRPAYKFQYVAACNPAEEGEDHWVYQRFIAGPDSEQNPTAREQWERDFANFHIPITQNVNAENLEVYIENLRASCSTPDEVQRAMEGKWVKRIKGAAIFKNYFLPSLHIGGSLDKKKPVRLVPHESKEITVGYDLGDVNHGVVFYQDIPVRTKFRTPDGKEEDGYKTLSVVFDEIVLVGEKLSGWEPLVRMILNKMNYWCEYKKTRFRFDHISDKSAFNRYRIGQGGIDQKEIEKYSRRVMGKDPAKCKWLMESIKMKDTPKMGGSVEERVKILVDKLIREEIIIDVRCKNVLDMFRNIVAEKDSVLTPKKGSPYKHALDALTYPMFFRAAKGNLRAKAVDTGPKVW